ncbi:extra-large guanine nucleotide-binding protein 3, partial [Trifolium medium]|nr:extra-large guanine nucleotide-binding protein 3 [Trifolium medium]
MDHSRGDSWRGLVNNMLPPGASVPDEVSNSDYSVALEYLGPPVPNEVPKVETLDVKSRAVERIPLPMSRITGVTGSPNHSP